MHNTKIDKIYERLADLVASRHSDYPDEALEEQISIHFRRLRELQKQEADRIRMATDTFLSGPIGDGLDILTHREHHLKASC